MQINTDRITLKGLKIYAYHGVFEDEKQKGQEFTVDITMHLDLCKAGSTDDLERTVNYGEAAELVQKVFTECHYNLIESAAEDVANKLLTTYKLIDSVDVEVFKPHAPISIDFENVSVFIHRARHTAYIAVGSNLGECEETINKAKEMFLRFPGNEILSESTLIVTKPYGVTDQPDFVNGLWKVRTLLEPLALLKKLNEIEARLGRERLVHWGPRTIDLDIIYYDDYTCDSQKLTIPHADMHNRDFVLKPLMEVDPYIRHPYTKLTAAQMLDKLK